MENNDVVNNCKPKKRQRPGRKLNPEAKRYVLRHLALEFPARYIMDGLKNIFDIEITHQAVYAYRKTKTGIKQIEAMKAQLIDKYMDHLPVARMVNRIAYAQELVDRGLHGYKTAIRTKSGDVMVVTIVNPVLIEKGVQLAQKELGTEKDEGLNDALKKSGPTFNYIDYGKLSEDECERRGIEWSRVFGSNGNGSGNSRF